MTFPHGYPTHIFPNFSPTVPLRFSVLFATSFAFCLISSPNSVQFKTNNANPVATVFCAVIVASVVASLLHLFLLLSGSRPEVIKQAKREHLNFRERVLFIPNPKGGVDKAFCIPLSRTMILCLLRAMTIGHNMHPDNADIWLFPADSATGHLVEHKEPREKLSHWGNELRQTYRTLGQIADINDIDMHLLMNHSLPGVNAGYITRNKLVGGHLRVAQQKISDRIMTAINLEDGTKAKWPFLSVRGLMEQPLMAKRFE